LLLSSVAKLRRWQQVRREGMEIAGLVYRGTPLHPPEREGFRRLWQPLCSRSPGIRPVATSILARSLPSLGTHQQATIFTATGPQIQMTLPQR